MSSYLQQLTEGRIDFIGQQLVEQIVRNVLVTATVVSFILGFALQSLALTFWMLGISTVVLVLTVIPGWGMYRRHGVEWLGQVGSSK
ncbi:hypothetical protein AMATHDRAFT_147488 [Amanita thiersii Skay4041]|uniref:Signal peptidase complex subunit 1 n=1 Tax=Amanita thiersii Skay4041 TaxID=703135 RepID=A0A2A9NPA1_9AGAR|nr:hypothetical protein AMATHDRAFT_147488 [Amanita thiersii Skay4041]